MRTLSSLLRREVVTESGRSLGRLYDLRGELTATNLRITGLCIGRRALLEHLGIRAQKPHTIIPWQAVARIEGKRIIVRDDAHPEAAASNNTKNRPKNPRQVTDPRRKISGNFSRRCGATVTEEGRGG